MYVMLCYVMLYVILSSFYPLPVRCKCNVIQQNWLMTIQAMKIN